MVDSHKRKTTKKKRGVRSVRKEESVDVLPEEGDVVVQEMPECVEDVVEDEFGPNGEPKYCKFCGSMNIHFRGDEPFPSIVIVSCRACGADYRHVRYN